MYKYSSVPDSRFTRQHPKNSGGSTIEFLLLSIRRILYYKHQSSFSVTIRRNFDINGR